MTFGVVIFLSYEKYLQSLKQFILFLILALLFFNKENFFLSDTRTGGASSTSRYELEGFSVERI